MPKVKFICLANSRKFGGRCVAGLQLGSIDWIRPVSSQADGTLSHGQYSLDDGTDASLLDVIEVEVTKPRPQVHQPENWELAPGRWHLVGRFKGTQAVSQLVSILVAGPILIENQLDHVDHSALTTNPASASLALIEPSSLKWNITTTFTGKRQTRCRFNLSGAAYDLAVTDMHVEKQLSSLSLGIHSRQAAAIDPKARVLLTISLGEPLNGICYKLVAAVIVID